jgi:hypothetical protein
MSTGYKADLAREALRAFEKALPHLWAERPEEWVAFRGAEVRGFAAEQHELYHQCFAKGFTPDEFVVFCIEPLPDEVVLGVDTGN